MPASGQIRSEPMMDWSAETQHRPRWIAPVASALVPGTGQLYLGSLRGVGYLAAEAGFVTGYLLSADAARDHRRRYRLLAFEVARAPFQPTVVDTAFQYFEQMTKFIESGPFDADPAPGIQPPTDPLLFNGSVWRLARETFFPDPDAPPAPDSPLYGQAIAFYRSRAAPPGFRWSWRGEEREFAEFRDLLRRSDDAFDRGTQFLGLLLVNHLVSLVDAAVSSRLRAAPASVGAAWRAAASGRGWGAWNVGIRVRW